VQIDRTIDRQTHFGKQYGYVGYFQTSSIPTSMEIHVALSLSFKEDYLFLPLSLRRINQRPIKSLYFPI